MIYTVDIELEVREKIMCVNLIKNLGLKFKDIT